jgi:hypothetical protein
MIRDPRSADRTRPPLAAIAAAVVAMIAMVLPSAANALVIGRADRPFAFDCAGPATYFQQANAATSPSYTVPAGGGLISSWETFGGTSSGAQVKLAVFRPTGTPNQFETIGSSAVQTIRAGQHNRADTQIPVLGGETIGLLILSGTHQCVDTFASNPADGGQRDTTAVHDAGSTFTYSNPSPGTLINVRADVSPAPRTLTLDANKNKVRRGKKVRLSGQVTSVNLQACAFGQAVTLERKATKKKGKMSPIAQVRTDAQGRFFAKSKVTATSKFRAEVAQTPSCGSAASKRETVKLKK